MIVSRNEFLAILYNKIYKHPNYNSPDLYEFKYDSPHTNNVNVFINGIISLTLFVDEGEMISYEEEWLEKYVNRCVFLRLQFDLYWNSMDRTVYISWEKMQSHYYVMVKGLPHDHPGVREIYKNGVKTYAYLDNYGKWKSI